MNRREFLKTTGIAVVGVGMGLGIAPHLASQRPAALEVPRILNSDVLRTIKKLMQRYEIESFPNNLWHASIHPDAEFDLVSDRKVQNIYSSGCCRSEENPLIAGVVPVVYGFKFYRNTAGTLGRASNWDKITHLRYNYMILVLHKASLAIHPDDVYVSYFYGPKGDRWIKDTDTLLAHHGQNAAIR